MSKEKLRHRQAGIVYILAMVLLTVFSSLAVAYASFSNTTLRTAENMSSVQDARMQAEGGLTHLTMVLSELTLSAGATGQAMMDDLASSLTSRLNGTANLQGAQVAYNGETITIPSIAMGSGKAFYASITRVNNTIVRLAVTGSDDDVSRTVSMDFNLATGRSAVFDYGIASKSPIRMTGNARVRGANSPAEANMLSATYNSDEAFKLTGNCNLEGDIYMSNPDAYVSLTGNVTIGGENNWSGNIEDHIHIGIGEVEFPEVDPTVFEPFATNVVDSSTSTSGNKTFTNIRILANSNPTFSGNITLKGVIFIEEPNNVHFSGNVKITGVIVTQDAGENNYDSNKIKFTGNTTVKGVEELPDTAEFQGLRDLPGAFILAPGFGLQFTGNFGTVSGAMAADEFKFAGNAGGVVHGPIINYSDSEFKLTGNSNLIIDRSDVPDIPPGFASPGKFEPNPNSYVEY